MSYMETEVRARKAAGISNAEIAAGIGIDEEQVERCLLGEHVVSVIISQRNNGEEMIALLEEIPGGTLFKFHRKSDATICLDILPPKDEPSKKWSTQIAKDLSEKSFNAVVAPRWTDD